MLAINFVVNINWLLRVRIHKEFKALSIDISIEKGNLNISIDNYVEALD